MGKVFLALTMSLDGFVARPGINNDNPFGTNGEQIHNWMFVNPTDADKAVGNRAMCRGCHCGQSYHPAWI